MAVFPSDQQPAKFSGSFPPTPRAQPMADFRQPGPDDDRVTGSPRTLWAETTRPPRTATVAPPPPGPVRLAPAPVRSRARPVRRAVRIIGWLLLGIAVGWAILLISYKWINPPLSTLMLAQRLTGAPLSRSWRPLSAISPHLARAVIMSEDAGFCGHRGVDWRELEAAYERGLDGGSQGGGSTISMQVTKNLFLWPSKSYVRKVIEIPLSLAADAWWGKPRILEIYLNIAEWGPGIFGAEAAARAYFSKSALALTETEAALLAVALPNPLQRNAADPAPRQRRMATVVQGRMKAGANNVRCLTRVAR